MVGSVHHPRLSAGPDGSDFLANPQAQHAAFAAHVGNIDSVIANTPGADQFNINGLRAVAHLGGNAGMQKFVQTGGKYNPADSNGTSLGTYYTRFSEGGQPALTAAFGHPDGYAATQGGQGGQQPPAASGGAPAQPVRLASLGGTAGMPATANDASGSVALPAPGSVGSASPAEMQATMARLRGIVGNTPINPLLSNALGPQAPSDPSTGSPAASPTMTPVPGQPGLHAPAPASGASVTGTGPRFGQLPGQDAPSGQPPRFGGAPVNQLMPQGAPPPVPQNALMPPPAADGGAPVPAAPPAPAGNPQFPPAPPGTQPLTQKGLPIPVPGMPGYQYGQAPDGRRVPMPMPGGVNTGRLTVVRQPDGSSMAIDPSGSPVYQGPPNTRDIQTAMYAADRALRSSSPMSRYRRRLRRANCSKRGRRWPRSRTRARTATRGRRGATLPTRISAQHCGGSKV